ncbi:fused (3R)-hydroxyacyl-ACP dehydratase subunits HadA/HadB [Nocardia nova]|uniref:fused (3R)-hydroxyacyl-ACP dehydratase subunits HadA/HadB n=1 Tax=Nocardia nova TaxID=37330 RepID=UPI0033D43DB6
MPELAPDAPASAELAGRHYRIRDRYEVGREKIREFARAVQNDHPAHHHEADARKLGWDSVVAPPTFASVIGMTTTQALLDNVLSRYDLSQILQTDQTFHIFRPIVAGDVLHSEAEIESIRHLRGNDFITVKATVLDAEGTVVQVGSATLVARLGGEVDADIVRLVEGVVMHRREVPESAPAILVPITADEAAADPDHRDVTVDTLPKFEDLAVGDQLPAATMRLTRGDLVNYAGVSSDPNPIHFSDSAAELAGLPTVVAHGLLTMGLGAQYLTSWLGDPAAVASYSVRFSGFVPVPLLQPAQIDFTARIKALDPDLRAATVLINATCGGKKLFGRALADVRLS